MFFLYRIRLFPNQLFIWNITIVTSINWTREIVWVHLRHCDSTFSCKLLLGFLRGVWIGQVWVEVLVQDLRRLLAEVSPLSSSVKEPGTKDHHCLAGTLLQLDLRIRKYKKKSPPKGFGSPVFHQQHHHQWYSRHAPTMAYIQSLFWHFRGK